MNCKYCDSELRIKRKNIDGKIHRIAYCDECHKKWDLDAKKQSVLQVIALYAILLLIIIGGTILVVKIIKKNVKDTSNAPEISNELTIDTQNHISTEEATADTQNDISAENEQTSKSFSGLQEYLSEQGIIDGEASEVMYEYIGAKNGVKYLNSNIELYEYDVSSSAYNEIITTNEISGIPVAAVNGPYVLIISNNEVNNTAVTVFKEY